MNLRGSAMAIASEFLIWQDAAGLFCRVTTNVELDELRVRLAQVGLLDLVEDIRAYFGDRRKGGSGYELRFRRDATWETVRRRVVKL
jgi:hypothetical protein